MPQQRPDPDTSRVEREGQAAAPQLQLSVPVAPSPPHAQSALSMVPSRGQAASDVSGSANSRACIAPSTLMPMALHPSAALQLAPIAPPLSMDASSVVSWGPPLHQDAAQRTALGTAPREPITLAPAPAAPLSMHGLPSTPGLYGQAALQPASSLPTLALQPSSSLSHLLYDDGLLQRSYRLTSPGGTAAARTAWGMQRSWTGGSDSSTAAAGAAGVGIMTAAAAVGQGERQQGNAARGRRLSAVGPPPPNGTAAASRTIAALNTPASASALRWGIKKDSTRRKASEIARLEQELRDKLSLASDLERQRQELRTRERLLKLQVRGMHPGQAGQAACPGHGVGSARVPCFKRNRFDGTHHKLTHTSATPCLSGVVGGLQRAAPDVSVGGRPAVDGATAAAGESQL